MPTLYCPHCNKPVMLGLVTADGNRQPQQSAFDEALGDRRPSIEALLETIEEDKLDSKSLQFVSEIKAKFEKYGSKLFMSPKQMAWLKSISEGKANKEF